MVDHGQCTGWQVHRGLRQIHTFQWSKARSGQWLYFKCCRLDQPNCLVTHSFFPSHQQWHQQEHPSTSANSTYTTQTYLSSPLLSPDSIWSNWYSYWPSRRSDSFHFQTSKSLCIHLQQCSRFWLSKERPRWFHEYQFFANNDECIWTWCKSKQWMVGWEKSRYFDRDQVHLFCHDKNTSNSNWTTTSETHWRFWRLSRSIVGATRCF